MEDQGACDRRTPRPVRLEHKGVRLGIVIELNAVRALEFVLQSPHQLFADGSVLQTLPKPFRINKYDLGRYGGLEGEDPPLLRSILLGTGLHKGHQRVIGQDHRFLPAGQLTVIAFLEPVEVDVQGSGGSVQAQHGEAIDVLGDDFRGLLQLGKLVTGHQKRPG